MPMKLYCQILGTASAEFLSVIIYICILWTVYSLFKQIQEVNFEIMSCVECYVQASPHTHIWQTAVVFLRSILTIQDVSKKEISASHLIFTSCLIERCRVMSLYVARMVSSLSQ